MVSCEGVLLSGNYVFVMAKLWSPSTPSCIGGIQKLSFLRVSCTNVYQYNTNNLPPVSVLISDQYLQIHSIKQAIESQ